MFAPTAVFSLPGAIVLFSMPMHNADWWTERRHRYCYDWKEEKVGAKKDPKLLMQKANERPIRMTSKVSMIVITKVTMKVMRDRGKRYAD
jgi:hypothetical protein